MLRNYLSHPVGKLPYWLSKKYRRSLITDAIKHLRKIFTKREMYGHSFLEFIRLLRTYLKRAPQTHLNKYEAVWKIFCTNTPKIIVEIGSYNGRDAVELSRMFPPAKVFTFEADANNFEKVKHNVAVRDNITPIQKAIFSHTGVVQFYPSKGIKNPSDFRGSGSCLEPRDKLKDTWPELQFDKPIQVPSITLDDWAKENDIKRIDFIWMDAQGAELSILQGTGNLLESVKAILLEIWQESYYKDSGSYNEIRDYLESHGFTQTHCWLEKDSGDVIFVNNELTRHNSSGKKI